MHPPVRRYRVIRPLGIGGMAEVHLARMITEDGVEKTVAIKLIRRDLVEPEVEQLFADEARVAMSLTHGNIVQAFDAGRLDGRAYLTLEYVEGTSLHQLLVACRATGRPFPIRHLYTVVVRILAGLGYAHRLRGPDGAPLGIVHRDVSPSNVLVSVEGEVKVADFGVAASRLRAATTAAGEVKGKFAYMAPEQARGDAVDPRADLYSVGVLAYEALVGTRPRPAAARIASADEAESAALAGRTDVPAALVRLLSAALAVDPAGRPASALQMREELERIAIEAGAPPSEAELARFVAEHGPGPRDRATTGAAGPAGLGGVEWGLRAASSADEAGPGFNLRLGAELEKVAQPGGGSVFQTRPPRVRASPIGPPPGRRHGGRLVFLGTLALALAGVATAGWLWSDRSSGESRRPVRQPIGAARARVESHAPAKVAPAVPVPAPRAAAAPARGAASRERAVEPAAPRVVRTPAHGGPSERRAQSQRPDVELASLWVASEPWANVYIDGQLAGRTALHGIRLRPGVHDLRLHNPASGLEKRIRVDLAPAETKRVSIDLGAP